MQLVNVRDNCEAIGDLTWKAFPRSQQSADQQEAYRVAQEVIPAGNDQRYVRNRLDLDKTLTFSKLMTVEINVIHGNMMSEVAQDMTNSSSSVALVPPSDTPVSQSAQQG